MSEARATILTWHSVSEDRPPLGVSPTRLARQLDDLLAAGFRVAPLGALVECLERGRGLPPRTLALTFDDGYGDFAQHALPLLEERGLPATLFVTASRERERLPGGTEAPLLALDALAGIAARGIEIGAHSVGHVDLTALDDAALERELRESRRVLEEHTGRPVEHFAYPFGRCDGRVRDAAARVFRSACTTRLARLCSQDDPWAMPRVDAYYLRSPLLRRLLAADAPDTWLGVRRRLRRWRGTEPAAAVGRGGFATCP